MGVRVTVKKDSWNRPSLHVIIRPSTVTQRIMSSVLMLTVAMKAHWALDGTVAIGCPTRLCR